MHLTTINKAIAQYGYELVRGNGYFYFFPLTDNTKQLYDESVMTTTLGKDLNFWIDELKIRIESTR